MKNRRLLRAVAVITAIFAMLSVQAFACTAFQLRSQDGAVIYFRSMEFGLPLQSQVAIIPRHTQFTGTAPNGQAGLKWTAKYGVVGLNSYVSPSEVTDGMNEKGLVVGMLYLPGYAQFLPPDASKTDRTIGDWELPTFLLSTTATVEEAREALLSEKAYVAQQILPALKQVQPVHFYITDKTGAVLIAEYLNGKLTLHDDPLGVLTNSPPFDWQTINLSNYVNLSSVNVPSMEISDVDIQNFSQGSGMLGIPGDYTPPSRFVRAALYSHWAIPGKTALETVNTGFHVLNTFDIFEGAIRSKITGPAASAQGQAQPKAVTTEPTDVTEWVVAHDRTNLRTYVRTYTGLTIQMIDLRTIDFDRPGVRQILLDNSFSPPDITSTAADLKGN
ncbi:MAG: choloylglycine hydrolase family protein [Candidatus Korobacteraceae bacterium]